MFPKRTRAETENLDGKFDWKHRKEIYDNKQKKKKKKKGRGKTIKATQQLKQTIQLEETNRKASAKEGRLKIYRDPNQRMKILPASGDVPTTAGDKGSKTKSRMDKEHGKRVERI